MEMIDHPLHPYTVLLLNSSPEPFREQKVEIHASEERPDLRVRIHSAVCRRCPWRLTLQAEVPETYEVEGRKVKCFVYENGTIPQGLRMDATI